MTTRTPRAPRVTISINEETITNSKQRDSSHCMIAEAVKAAYPDASHVAVDLQTIRFTDRKKGYRYTYLTPRVGQVALVNFDQGREVTPWSMSLRGGQVSRSGSRQTRAGATESDAQRRQRSAALSRGRSLEKARLVTRDASKGDIPDRIGGKTPPSTPFARRRAFGLRALER